MRRSQGRLNCKLTRAVMILLAAGVASAIAQDAKTDEAGIVTHISCSDPKVPTLILQVAFPGDVGVFQKALGRNVCRYSDDDQLVTPLYFVAKVEAEPAAAERFGYIWAIRLDDRKVSYWYFWKDEHEELLRRMRSN